MAKDHQQAEEAMNTVSSQIITKMKFRNFPWLCSALFLDPSAVQVLVLCNI